MPALPAAARAISAAVTEGVAAARAQDTAAFEEATGRLAALDPAPVAEVLGGVVRSLLEQAHPSGLAGDDVRAVLTGCTRSASWASDVDPAVLVVVLGGALGLSADDQPPVAAASVGRHAVLLCAHLLGPTGRVSAHLDTALAELARAQTVEMP